MSSSRTVPLPEPVEFSIEDALLSTWEEDPGDYLRLDPSDFVPPEPPNGDHA